MKVKVTSRLILLIFVAGIALLLSLIILLRSAGTKWQLIIAGLAIVVPGVFLLKGKNKKPDESSDLLDIGRQIFPAYQEELAGFYNLYATDKEAFLVPHSRLLRDPESFDPENLKPVELIYIFAKAKGLVSLTDWRGEENEYEIETFLENLLNRKPAWAAASAYRAGPGKVRQKEGQSAIGLFGAIDKDLLAINQRLLFLELGWDAYVYTTVPSEKLDEITSKAPGYFHGAQDL